MVLCVVVLVLVLVLVLLQVFGNRGLRDVAVAVTNKDLLAGVNAAMARGRTISDEYRIDSDVPVFVHII